MSDTHSLPAKTNPATALKLSQAALILLGQAAARQDGMVLPPPAALRARGGALQKVLQALLKAALVIEVPVEEVAQSWRRGEDEQHFGLAITAEGFQAIGLPVPEPAQTVAVPSATIAPDRPTSSCIGEPDAAGAKRITKQAKLVTLLSAEGGQSVAALAEMLAWQNHTVRAALTGLRQKGHALTKVRTAEGTTVYRIATGQGATPVGVGQGA